MQDKEERQQVWHSMLCVAFGAKCKQKPGIAGNPFPMLDQWSLGLNEKCSRGFSLPITFPAHSPLSALVVGIVCKPPVCCGAEDGVRSISDPFLRLAVCMLNRSSLRDKPSAQQSCDSAAEQYPIIPVWGPRGWSLARGLDVPGQMAPWNHLAGPVMLLGGFDTCQRLWLSAFVSYQRHQLFELLGSAALSMSHTEVVPLAKWKHGCSHVNTLSLASFSLHPVWWPDGDVSSL